MTLQQRANAILSRATDQQIRRLRIEAGACGDTEMVTICEAALNGHAQARIECARVIAEAQS